MRDVIVVGGGPAGLSAALVLGRARRNTLVLDAGEPRNAAALHAHGVLTRDGVRPGELLELAREELERYPTVELRATAAIGASAEAAGFEVTLANGASEFSRKLLLATGVRDELPAIDGIARLWGASVFHCPYCDGWEVRGGAIAALASGADALEFVPVLLGWSDDLILCTNGPDELSPRVREQLEQRGVRIIATPIARLDGDTRLERIVFSDGTALAREALFVKAPLAGRSELGAQLGCVLSEHGLIEVTAERETTVPGVYAAGDAACRIHQIVVAAASGVEAAMRINGSLAMEDFAAGTPQMAQPGSG